MTKVVVIVLFQDIPNSLTYLFMQNKRSQQRWKYSNHC